MRVKVALTCGTDVKVFRRGYHARMIVPPAVFGHELAGDIVAVGEDVAGFSRGPARGGGQLRPLRGMLLLPRGLRESLRGPAVQQRRLRRIHPHPGAHRRAQHVRDSRLTSATRMPRWSSRWPACCAASKRPHPRAATPSRHRPGPHRPDVRQAGQGLRLPRDRGRAAARRSSTAPRAMGADELLIVDGRRFRSGQAVRDLTARPRRRHRHRSRRQAGDLGMGRQHGAPRRHGQLLRRLPQRQPRQPGHVPAALLRDHLQGQLPPHARPTSGRRSTWSAAAHITAAFFVNREEPLANLLEVMRHLMSHNGHLKTAIIP